MKEPFDAIVVGGGHNGLACAGYLAGSGLRVLVLERRGRVGGPAAKVEFLPGYSTTYSNSPGSLEPKIVRDLELERHGLRYRLQNPMLVHPLEDGRLFVAWRDRARIKEQLESFAPGEAGRYDAFFRYLQTFADKLGISLFRPPPTLQELVRNLTTLADQEAFARIFLGSVRDLFDEFCLAPQTQAILGPLGIVGGFGAPSTPGTPINYLMRPLSIASLAVDSAQDPRRHPLAGLDGHARGGWAPSWRRWSRARRAGGLLSARTPLSPVSARGRARGGE